MRLDMSLELIKDVKREGMWCPDISVEAHLKKGENSVPYSTVAPSPLVPVVKNSVNSIRADEITLKERDAEE